MAGALLWSASVCARTTAVEEVSRLSGSGQVAALIPLRNGVAASVSYVGSGARLVIQDGRGTRTIAIPGTKSVAWALVQDRAGKLYLGTDEGKVVRVDPGTDRAELLGAIRGETMIWQFALGSDGHVYGVTYPNAKLVRVRTSSGEVEDLGQVDPEQPHAREIAASRDGHLYLWTGMKQIGLYAYRIRDGRLARVMPRTFEGRNVEVELRETAGGDVFVALRERGKTHWFRGSGLALTATRASEVQPSARTFARVDQGRSLYRLLENGRARDLKLDLPQSQRNVFRLGHSGSGEMLVFGAMPASVDVLDGGRLSRLATVGTGEVYSSVAGTSGAFIGAYAAEAPVFFQDRSGRLRPLPSASIGKDWRPLAAVTLGDRAFFGALPGYREQTGLLVEVTPSGIESVNRPVEGHGIGSLVAWKDQLIGGTVTPSGTARVFLWDPKRARVVRSVQVDHPAVTNLVRMPDGSILGLAGRRENMREWFVLDPQTFRIRASIPLDRGFFVNSHLNNSAVEWKGKVMFLTTNGVAELEPRSGRMRLVAKQSDVTVGGAVMNGYFYFASGPRILRTKLP